VVDVLRRLSLTFPVSGPAVAAGVAALHDEAYRRQVLAHNTRWREWLRDQLADVGLEVLPSSANFLLVRLDPAGGAAEAAWRYLSDRGILVRMFASPAYRDMLRITIGLEREMHAAAEALRAFRETATAGQAR
jgi:histidinol-phosphate aminotransferase